MKAPKLSVQSHWLLRYLAERGSMASTTPMPAHWSQKPGLVNMRGLIRRGWAEERNRIFFITEAGRKAAEQVGPCPPVKQSLSNY